MLWNIIQLLKRKKILTYATTQINPEDSLLSEISQSQKDYVVPLVCGTQTCQSSFDKKQNGCCQGLERQRRHYCLIGSNFQFCKMKRVLGMDVDDGGTIIYLTSLSCTCIVKMVNLHYIYFTHKFLNAKKKGSLTFFCQLLSCVRLLATPWTLAPQAPLSVECSLQGIFLAQGSNPGILHCRQILYHLSHHRGFLES